LQGASVALRRFLPERRTIMKKEKQPKPLTNTAGELDDDVTEANQDMEREFEKGDKAEVPKADRPGGLRGNPT